MEEGHKFLKCAKYQNNLFNKGFKKAQEKNAILFVDEADALFGRRKRADKQERYTTASVDWLLERFEASKCFVLVGANDRGSLDSGFMKRIKLAIEQSGA